MGAHRKCTRMSVLILSSQPINPPWPPRLPYPDTTRPANHPIAGTSSFFLPRYPNHWNVHPPSPTIPPCYESRLFYSQLLCLVIRNLILKRFCHQWVWHQIVPVMGGLTRDARCWDIITMVMEPAQDPAESADVWLAWFF